MTEVERILAQHDRALHGGAWHGDSVWEILEGIRWEQAFRRVLPATHTIWELVMHMAFWETEVNRRLQKLPGQSQDELNFPAMPEPAAHNWQRALDTLRKSNADFRTTVMNLSDSKLDEALSSPKYTVYVELHGVFQHHLYHAGQIALLKKVL
jgi:hypothetical protein